MKSVAQVLYRRLRATSALVSYSPASLFASNEPGGWYDPSDLTTMFQDAAGTTPVTAVEQPVGLVLDKSKNGVGTNGAKRVNLLTYTEQFNESSAWATSGRLTVSANTTETTDPLGGNTAEKITETIDNGTHRVSHSVSVLTATNYTFSCYVKKGTRQWAHLFLFAGDTLNSNQTAQIQFYDLDNVVTGTQVTSQVIGTVSQVTFVSASIIDAGNGWRRLFLTCSFIGANGQNATVGLASQNGTFSYAGSTSEYGYIWGADLRPASEASTLPTYQRITADWPSTMSGSHLSQSTSTARPVLSARVNLLTRTEELDNAAWADGGNFSASVSANAAVAPNGTTTADQIVLSATAGSWGRRQDVGSWPSVTGLLNVWVKAAATGSATHVRLTTNNGVGWNTGQSVKVALTSDWQLVSMSGSLITSGSTVRVIVGVVNAGGSVDPDCYGNVLLWGADLRPSNAGVGLPAYQRVGASTDYDTTGFPLYLKFDGTDDWLASSAINFTSTDKLNLFAGLRKLNQSTDNTVAEVGTASGGGPAGSVVLFAGGNDNSVYSNYTVYLKGTALTGAQAKNYAAPITNVISVACDISQADWQTEILFKVNSQTPATVAVSPYATSAAGTGNFGNHALYVGSRGGTGERFNGHLYSLIIRGAETDAATISSTETWVNGKTKAYGPVTPNPLIWGSGNTLIWDTGNNITWGNS